MKNIYDFLDNTLVREWIAPIFTTVVGAALTKVLIDRKKEPSATMEGTHIKEQESPHIAQPSQTFQLNTFVKNRHLRIIIVSFFVFIAARFIFRPIPDDPINPVDPTTPTESSSETTSEETESETETWKDDHGTEFIGKQVNGKIEGYGQANFANGESYEGEFKSGLCEGYGVKYFPDGGRFEGNFKAGQIDGDGIYYWENGNRFEGKWANGARTGKGIFTSKEGDSKAEVWLEDVFVTNMIYESEVWADTDGVFYVGKKEDDKINGYGRAAYTDGGIYLGEFKDGLKEGQGIYYFKNSSGLRYEGEWKENKYFGEGTLWYAPDDAQGRWYFEGEWLEDSQNGIMYYRDGTCKMGIFQNDELVEATGEINGILNQPDVVNWEDEEGNKYTGKQENGILVGKGIHIDKDNQLYIGEFQEGKPGGTGTQYYSDGDYYVGDLAAGKRNGLGVYYYSDNGDAKSWYCGEWADGKRNGSCSGYFHDNGSLDIGKYKEGFLDGKGISVSIRAIKYPAMASCII